MQYLVVVDRPYSWPLVYRATELSVGELVVILKQVFTSYVVAEEFTSDRATVFTGHVFDDFCKTWCVWYRVSSANHPHSNLRAMLAVKTIKRFAADCTGPWGSHAAVQEHPLQVLGDESCPDPL